MNLPDQPSLLWSEAGFPKDGRSGDVFFSRDGGLGETEAVFLAGCGLPDAWRGRALFSIGELGFGSGLNALACWRLWRDTRQPGAVLHYFSVESHPWTARDAARAHAAFPQIADLSTRLVARWPRRAFGMQRRWFAQDGFCLTLLIGECEQALRGLRGSFDAWFLDGFAPAKNPQMWSGPVMQEIARLSAPDARLATYSVAAPVREALGDAGFSPSKQPGFGRKRQRLEARLTAPLPPRHALFPRGEQPLVAAGERGARVMVIGAGIAGASVTQALARRGMAVILLEAASSPAQGASGNPLALLTPRLDRSDDAGARFFRAAYLAALDAYAGQDWFFPIGALQRPRNAADAQALRLLLANSPLPPELVQAHRDGVWHPHAGTLDPARLINAWTAQAHRLCAARVARLEHENGLWRACDGANHVLAEAEAAVLCSGPALAGLAQTAWLPLAWSSGQIEFARQRKGLDLPHAFTGPGYAAPWGEGLIFGATFTPQPSPAPAEPSLSARAANLAGCAALIGEDSQSLQALPLISRTGIRASAPDRLPIAGLLPDALAWLAQQAGLAHGRPADLSRPAPALPGLYVLGGLSARGFLSAPLLGEMIAADLCGEPSPLDAGVLDALHPARFLLRARKRGQSVV